MLILTIRLSCVCLEIEFDIYPVAVEHLMDKIKNIHTSRLNQPHSALCAALHNNIQRQKSLNIIGIDISIFENRFQCADCVKLFPDKVGIREYVQYLVVKKFPNGTKADCLFGIVHRRNAL